MSSKASHRQVRHSTVELGQCCGNLCTHVSNKLISMIYESSRANSHEHFHWHVFVAFTPRHPGEHGDAAVYRNVVFTRINIRNTS